MMRKILASFALLAAPLMAVAIENPISASLLPCESNFYKPWKGCGLTDNFELQFGFLRTDAYNHSMALSKDSGGSSPTISFTPMVYEQAQITLNYLNRFSLFFWPGTMHFAQTLRQNTFGIIPASDFSVTYFTDTSFAYTVGGRATILEWCNLGLGGSVKYTHSNQRVNYINDLYPAYHLKGTFWETQVDAGLAYRFCPCNAVDAVPYIAARGAWSQLTWGNAQVTDSEGNVYILFDQKQARVFGYGTGISLTFCGRVEFLYEATFLNERSTTLMFAFNY